LVIEQARFSFPGQILKCDNLARYSYRSGDIGNPGKAGGTQDEKIEEKRKKPKVQDH
jgi:hypothetical protein